MFSSHLPLWLVCERKSLLYSGGSRIILEIWVVLGTYLDFFFLFFKYPISCFSAVLICSLQSRPIKWLSSHFNPHLQDLIPVVMCKTSRIEIDYILSAS